MRCDVRVSSFASVVLFFQLAPQCCVTARFETSPRGPAGRAVSYLSIVIVPVKRSLVGVVCTGSNVLNVSPSSLVRRISESPR